MSETRALQKSSDFSIERILSKDISPKNINFFDEQKVQCSSLNKKCLPLSDGESHFEKSDIVWVEYCKMQDQDSKLADEEERNDGVVSVDKNEMPWLQCTRYRPPRLPRKSSAGKNVKRRLGSHPRIPFTKLQLQILEEKYKINAYLSRRDVIHLSGILHLPQSRVKIWFQNRRARDRKESQSFGHFPSVSNIQL